MLLALTICYLSVFAAANPFHKYPFVFLLDVGNEELEKTNSEQIRVSVPGGSVALRYPAIGNGDTISHVRVTGIDFGTDLKANIVDGGPGYKYVVFVFIGNRGVPYDAVVTVQTVSDNTVNIQTIGSVVDSKDNAYQSEEDANNSAEDLTDVEVGENQAETSIQDSNAELMQSSANVYSYIENESIIESDDINESSIDDSEVDNDNKDDIKDLDEIDRSSEDNKSDFDDVKNVQDIHLSSGDDIVQEYDVSAQVNSNDAENDADEDNNEEEISSDIERSYDYSDPAPIIVDSNLYSKYKALKDHLDFGREVYNQEQLQKNDKPIYQEDPSDYEDTDSADSMYDDDESNNRIEKYRDPNNNYVNSDDSYAVAY